MSHDDHTETNLAADATTSTPTTTPQKPAATGGANATPPQLLTSLKGSAAMVWIYLHLNPRDPTIKDMQAAIGRSENTVQAAVSGLEAAGLIEVDRRKPRNKYKLLLRIDDLTAPPTQIELVPPTSMPSKRRWQARDGHWCRSQFEIVLDDHLEHLGVAHWCDVPLSRMVPSHTGKHTVDRVVPPYVIEVAGFRGDDYEERLKAKATVIAGSAWKLIVVRRIEDIYKLQAQFKDRAFQFLSNLNGNPQQLRRFKREWGLDNLSTSHIFSTASANYNAKIDSERRSQRRRAPKRHPQRLRFPGQPQALKADRKKLHDIVVDTEKWAQQAKGKLGEVRARLAIRTGPLTSWEVKQVQSEVADAIASPMPDGFTLLVADPSKFAKHRHSWIEERLQAVADESETLFELKEAARKVEQAATDSLTRARDAGAMPRHTALTLQGHFDGIRKALVELDNQST